ncbi:leucine-rich repeat receptor-like serine/threonine/tyrosine-protein kinase sobir1 [Phtheirospermum japonicum]|uniref:Leucine-rich repeat receptor-like serine/threonine/tyrosine-protein kinase sobir1 n=1 Tax=Phtheirospermum japonicum TaxID=374723 RepID=A0A830BGX9_9LAMI|nr:leucine-rich repeat receptor-like serine/threonine/tyrosine-protein kinase sobir1 [Phtheirospermum japonicum]
MNHSARIIHRGLKPANVLLDNEMEARISGFRLAKVGPDANTHVTTSNVAETVWYIAPEFYQTLCISAICIALVWFWVFWLMRNCRQMIFFSRRRR